MKTMPLPLIICPSCGYHITAGALAFGSNEPNEGDISICLKCGHLSAFDANKRLRPLTDDEMIAVAGDPRVIQLQKARAKVIKP
ncbi:MAG: hypothetical protein C5B60_04750 [Chloroflexi bacterium]|nr:MAG: hypothetical protein C5B60_04750 [Chloroflexota bacterium]